LNAEGESLPPRTMEVVVKKALQVLTLVPLLLVTASYHNCDPEFSRTTTVPTKFLVCAWPPCDHVVHIDSHCDPVDDSGASLDPLVVQVGDRVCFVNDSGCTVKLKFDTELFNRSVVSLEAGKCWNFSVLSTGRGNNYSYEIICRCPDGSVISGSGSGNPEVRVEEEDTEEEP